MEYKVRFDDKVLRRLMKAVKNTAVVELGVLGGQPRQDGETNAEIGAKHEYGDPTDNLPARSFLRMPLSMHLHERIDQAKQTIEKAVEQSVQAESMVPIMETVGAIGKGIVLEAFATEGFGNWQKHAAGYTNNTGMVLQDTQSLKKSINYRVKKDD